MMDNKPVEISAQKKIIVANPSNLPPGKQFVVTQSKGTTIIQPALHTNPTLGTPSHAQQYIGRIFQPYIKTVLLQLVFVHVYWFY